MSNSSSPKGVGYGQPPVATQFKPGQSGNPKGRPKGSKNMLTLLMEELDQKVTVTSDGRSQRMSKRRIAVRQQVDRAAQGDSKAFATIMKLEGQGFGGDEVDAPGMQHSPSEIPLEIYDAILAGLRAGSSVSEKPGHE
jgi:hypothetical protein